MGPGIITAAANNDAGGITTYSVAGAKFGYDMLWVLLLLTVLLAITQEMGARMGAVTGKGLADLIREEYGLRAALLALVTLLTLEFSVFAAMSCCQSTEAETAPAAEVGRVWLFGYPGLCGAGYS
jgi:NRAMP (natural resistance-associated macrophage protein)-like metal ion transporter